MDEKRSSFSSDVFSSFHRLAQEHPQFEDAQMLVGASDAKASLKKKVIRRSVDTEWVNVIEEKLPYLDLAIRQPFRAIEDVEEIIPVELSRRISEKSIKHLAQHTNLILKVEGDEVTPSKILNVFHEETLLTYENKFINTLINRLFAFVDKRYQILKQNCGSEEKFALQYDTDFHHQEGESAQTGVAIGLHMELSTPVSGHLSEKDKKNNDNYITQLQRVERIYQTLLVYMGSQFVKAMGKNYIRPPVIRTNAILKNKNMKACLELWEYISGFDKAGYTVVEDSYKEMPSDRYIRELYSSVALQYLQFYYGVTQKKEGNRLLSQEEMTNVTPDFETGEMSDEHEDYTVYDAQYRKLVPVSRLLSSRRKLSESEAQIRAAIDVALKADKALEARRLAEEAEARRRAEEEEARRKAEEEEARRLAEEAEARRIAEEAEKRRLAREAEERRKAEEAEKKRLAEEARARQAAAETIIRLLAAEAEKRCLAEEVEQRRLEEEARARRAAAEALAGLLAGEAERRRLAEEAEERRKAEEAEAKRRAEKAERQRLAEEAEAKRLAEEAERRRLAEKKEKQQRTRAAFEARVQSKSTHAQSSADRIAKLFRAANEERANQHPAENKTVPAAEIKIDPRYSREAYLALPRRKKKTIKRDLQRLEKYEELLQPGMERKHYIGPYWDEIRHWKDSIQSKDKQ